MERPTTESSVREWLVFRPGLSRIFSRHDVDLCHDADQTVADVCLARHIDSQTMLAELTAAARPRGGELGADWSTTPLGELSQHIVEVHHAFYESELPRLAGLIETVVATYAAVYPELQELEQAFGNFCSHFKRHLVREQQELFPAIGRLDRAEPQPASFNGIATLINSLERDHELADAELRRIRDLTHGFAAPSDACQTYHAMLDGLWELEMHLHQNVYEEDEFLFPRAIRREVAP